MTLSEDSVHSSSIPVEVPGVASELVFLRSVLASSADCIKVLDIEGNLVYMSDMALTMMEVSDFNAIAGCPWPDFWRDGLNEEAKAALEKARRGGEGRFEGEALTFKGTAKWWDVRVTCIRGSMGRPDGLLVVSRDITRQKEAEAQRQLVTLEMAHRVKNILAVVQAIAAMSLRDGQEVSTARVNFNARLLALAKAQDQLLHSSSQPSLSLSQLLSDVLVIHGDPQQLTWDGPHVVFGPAFGLSFSLVIHELYTNALKYGALSSRDGCVTITWKISRAAAEPTFELEWVETGGPLVTPPSRRGFGSRLIERSLQNPDRSAVQITYPPMGVRFLLSATLGHVLGH